MSIGLAEAPSLNLGRAFTWMFKSPKWTNNLLWSVLCVLLGTLVIGNIVQVGYQIEIIQRRSRGRTEDHVDFDPNRFVDYLVRGLIPAAIYLIVGMGCSAIGSTLMFGWMGAFAAVMGPNPRDLTALVMLLPVILLAFLQAIVVLLVAIPLALRAGLTNDFSEGLKFKWALNTARFMWPTILLALVYVLLCAFVNIFGFLFFCVGVFVTTAWMQLVLADLGAQLVDIYLAKGGEPLPMHGEVLQAEIL